jgi:hypothetical protein
VALLQKVTAGLPKVLAKDLQLGDWVLPFEHAHVALRVVKIETPRMKNAGPWLRLCFDSGTKTLHPDQPVYVVRPAH